MWLTECKNPRAKFFFSAFSMTLLFSQRLFSPLLFWACSADVAASGSVISLIIVNRCMVNRLKIPQGLSTSLFHWWSEVPSRGGVCGDSL